MLVNQCITTISILAEEFYFVYGHVSLNDPIQKKCHLIIGEEWNNLTDNHKYLIKKYDTNNKVK